VPSLGRFLEVDPVEGGSCNDYDYVCGDPVNRLDLDGTEIFGWSCQACADFASGVLNTVTFNAGEPLERAFDVHDRVNHDSEWRDRGGWAGLAVPGGAVVRGGAKAVKAGWRGKLAIHKDHHSFKRLGGRKLPHVQLNVWQKGVKASGRTVFRVPFPKRWFP
jgi:hypothetical protein